MFDRAAGFFPRVKAALDVAYRLEAHSLYRLCRKGRTQSARAKEYELLSRPEDVLVVGAFGIDPEFEHPARRVEGAWNATFARQFSDIAQIDNHNVGIVFELDRLRGSDGFDFGVSFRYKFLDALFHLAFSFHLSPPILLRRGKVKRQSTSNR